MIPLRDIGFPTVVFTEGHGLPDAIIRFASFSHVTHVAIGLGPSLLHATRHGVVLNTREYWRAKGNTPYAEFEILPDVSEEIAHLRAQVGRKYDYITIVEHFLRRLMDATTSVPVRRVWWPARKGIVCSSFVLQLNAQGKIPEWEGLDPLAVLPVDLYERCRYGRSFRPLYDKGNQGAI